MTNDILQRAIQAEMDANRVDLRLKRQPFASPTSAFEEFALLGFGPLWSDAGDHMTIRANGIAVVTYPDGYPAEAQEHEWKRAPVFVDAKDTHHFLFTTAGHIDAEVFNFCVRSYPALPFGFGWLEERIEVPPSDNLAWVRPPHLHKAMLPTLPAYIRFELAQRLASEAA